METVDTTPTSPRPNAGDAAPTRTRWGRSSRLGGGTGRLLALSLALGTFVAALLGTAALWLGGLAGDAAPDRPEVLAALVAAFCLPVGGVLAWVLLVDRDTVAGAVRHPERSVESQWYDRAAVGAFHDLVILLGLGTFVASLTHWHPDLGLVGTGLLLLLALDVAVRYLVAKRRG